MQKTSLCIFIFFFSIGSSVASAWDANIQKEETPLEITVHYDPKCDCCTSWVSHLKKHNFKVIDVKDSDMATFKEDKQIPAKMQSCHTATVGDYVIEGHVPANDIKALLRSHDKNIYGLSVPKMPVGTPGMEMGTRKDPFAVISFDKEGNTSTYKTYQQY